MDPLNLVADAAATDPMSLLQNWGPLGVISALLIAYARTSIRREQERTERAEQQVRDLNDFIRNELLPKQVEATLLHQQVAEVLGEAVEMIADIKAIERTERRRARP